MAGSDAIRERESPKRLIAEALRIGFHSLGISEATRSPHADRFLRWIEKKQYASMRWITRNTQRRIDPRKSLPGARSVLTVTLPYSSAVSSTGPSTDPGAKVARYARGRDYHKVMRPMLESLCEFVSEGDRWNTWWSVDTSPLLERDWAELSGIGWIGKNGIVIDHEIGSWFFLGAIVTDRSFVPSTPAMDHCGSCTRCIDACPTSAIVSPRTIDAGRCISYWTIEHRGELPEESRLHNWLFGCDICQEVCPWNTREGRKDPQIHPELAPRQFPTDPQEITHLSHEAWLEIFAGTPVTRTGYEGLKRNAHKIIEQRSDPGE
ncbi:MAG: tRNA epoxyqueuosine(34) reductase QueG [Planctomycetota bacterium]